MFFHFRNTTQAFPSVAGKPPPTTPEDQQALIDKLQAFKTDYFKTLVATKAKARPGVVELMDEALEDPTVAVGVCSAATKVCPYVVCTHLLLHGKLAATVLFSYLCLQRTGDACTHTRKQRSKR